VFEIHPASLITIRLLIPSDGQTTKKKAINIIIPMSCCHISRSTDTAIL
jgi:hypothetical protein